MIDKTVGSVAEALDCIGDDAVALLGGFGAVGQADALVEGLIARGVRDLTIVANNAGLGEVGLARLLAAGQMRRVVSNFPRGGAGALVFEGLYRTDKVELEVVPQGTLAEGRQTRELNGRTYLLEYAVPGDMALVEVWQADRWGNLTYRASGRNFNPVMAMAARLTVVQTAHVAKLGALAPDSIVTPGIFVDRVVQVA